MTVFYVLCDLYNMSDLNSWAFELCNLVYVYEVLLLISQKIEATCVHLHGMWCAFYRLFVYQTWSLETSWIFYDILVYCFAGHMCSSFFLLYVFQTRAPKYCSEGTLRISVFSTCFGWCRFSSTVDQVSFASWCLWWGVFLACCITCVKATAFVMSFCTCLIY